MNKSAKVVLGANPEAHLHEMLPASLFDGAIGWI